MDNDAKLFRMTRLKSLSQDTLLNMTSDFLSSRVGYYPNFENFHEYSQIICVNIHEDIFRI